MQVGGKLACTEGSAEGLSAPEDLQASLLLGTFPDATFKHFHLSAGKLDIIEREEAKLPLLVRVFSI